MERKVKAIITTLCVSITISLSALAQARGWRGIVPLHSTRADVERLLGQPNEMLSPYSAFYRTANETVIVNYATGFSCGIGEKYSQWRVSKDTVESILVTPFKGFPVSQLLIDETKFEKRSGGHRTEDVYYINDQDGQTIRVVQSDVMTISFYPGRVDAELSCSGLQPSSSKPCEGLTPPAFASYREGGPEQGKVHLDSFAVLLQRDRSSMGYIIAYAGKRTTVGEAERSAEHAKNYLVNVRRLSTRQLKTIDGGYREAATIELYAVQSNGCPPVSNATVDPREVQIVEDGNARTNRRPSRRIKN